MKKRFLKSIAHKVRLSILGTAVVAVVVSGSFFVVTEYSTYRDGFVENISSMSDVIAYNLTAPIVFSNKREANLTLESFATAPSVELGFVVDDSGSIVASYARDNVSVLPGSPE